MTNLIDYLESNQPSFDERPFCEVDSAVLASFCMIDAEFAARPLPVDPNFAQRAIRRALPGIHSITFSECLRAERFDGMFRGPNPEGTKRVLYGLSASPRFRDLRVGDFQSAFDEKAHLQFAATTFTLPGRFCYVGFRGTDRSVTGWREDFDIALRDEVPAQTAAARYLESVATVHRERLYVGGHSKGGFLAVSASLAASPKTRDRIGAVFSHDGPGMREGTFDEVVYDSMSSKIFKSVPQDSLIGLLFETRIIPSVVESNARGIEQHDLLTWEVDLSAEHGPSFRPDSLSDSATHVSAALNSWISETPREDIEAIVDTLFEVLEDPRIDTTLPEAFSDPHVLRSFLKSTVDPAHEHARRALLRALGHFASATATAIGTSVRKRAQ